MSQVQHGSGRDGNVRMLWCGLRFFCSFEPNYCCMQAALRGARCDPAPRPPRRRHVYAAGTHCCCCWCWGCVLSFHRISITLAAVCSPDIWTSSRQICLHDQLNSSHSGMYYLLCMHLYRTFAVRLFCTIINDIALIYLHVWLKCSLADSRTADNERQNDI